MSENADAETEGEAGPGAPGGSHSGPGAAGSSSSGTDAATGGGRRRPLASPWPVFVALGLPVAEIGVLFGVFPVAVGGLLLFAGSLSGLVSEAGYASTSWRALAAFGVLFLALGAVVVLATVFDTRGQAIVVAGGVLLAGGVAGELFGGEDPVI